MKLTGCTMACSEAHTYEYGCLLDRCGDPAPATVTFDLPTPDTRAAFLRNTKAAIEAACPDITVVFYGKAPKYVEEQWSPDAVKHPGPVPDKEPACTCGGGVDDHDAATHYRDCPVHDPVACPLCLAACDCGTRSQYLDGEVIHNLGCSGEAARIDRALRAARRAREEIMQAKPTHLCETSHCWSECHPTYNVGFTGGKVTPGARRVPVSPDIVGEDDVRRATLADHHPACQDPNDDPADCLECAEAAEDEADFARRHRETLLDYTDFYAVPTAGDYYAARKRAACHRECRGAADCIGMVNGKCMAPTTEKENDADAGTGLFATVRRGARAFRRGFIAAFTATGGPGGKLPG